MRYSRQIILNEIGEIGQQTLSRSKVLVVGAGGLGSPALMYLAAAGIGTIGIVEYDFLELSNLQRQVLFKTKEIGKKKSKSAFSNLTELNHEIKFIEHNTRLETHNVLDIFKSYEIILDCTDNLETKYLINDACLKLGIAFIFGSISKFEGRVANFNLNNNSCYRCLYPESPTAEIQNCGEAGILGAVAGIIGSMQALEAIKILLKLNNLDSKLLILDTLSQKQMIIPIKKHSSCICNDPEKIEFSYSESELNLEQFLAIKNNSIIIDIRESDELLAGTIPNSIHWPMSKIKIEIFSKEIINQTEKCILYCKSGVRSKIALNILKDNNLHGARHLTGGYDLFRKGNDL